MTRDISSKKYYVYIVKCADGSYYTGKTINIEKRILQHNGKLVNGAHYTKTRRPVTLIYFEELVTNSLAMKREREIKKYTRSRKEKLISEYILSLNT